MATHLCGRFILLSAVVALMTSGALADSFMGEYTGTFFADSVTQMPATAIVVAESEHDWRIIIDAVSPERDRQGARIEVYGNLQGQGVDISYPSGGYRWHGGIQGHISPSKASTGSISSWTRSCAGAPMKAWSRRPARLCCCRTRRASSRT